MIFFTIWDARESHPPESPLGARTATRPRQGVQAGKPGVLGLRHVHAQLAVQGDREVERVHRVEVELFAEVDAGNDARRVHVGRDLQGERGEIAEQRLCPVGQLPLRGVPDLVVRRRAFELVGLFSTELGPHGHDLGGGEDSAQTAAANALRAFGS